MNVTHPDDQDEEIDIDQGKQESDDSEQSNENAPTQLSPGMNRSTSNPNIINK